MKKITLLLFALLCGVSKAQFSEPQIVYTAYDVTPVEIKFSFKSDVDLDGQPDIVQPDGTWYKRDVTGEFGTARTFTPPPPGKVYAMADLDGDGAGDVVVQDGHDLYWLASEGNGALGAPQLIGTLVSTNSNLLRCVIEDMNNDGAQDVMVAVHNFGQPFQIIWWPQLGDGSFSDGLQIHQWPHQQSASTYVEMVDGDGDGDLDILFDLGTEGWLVNEGSGTFSDPVPVGVEQPEVANFKAGDPDGDGDQDVLVSTYLSDVIWYENLGGMTFGSAAVLHPVEAARSTQVMDWDSDGDMDVLVEASGGYTLLLRGVDGTYTSTAFEPLPFSYPFTLRPQVQDLNGDGTLDILMSGDVVGFWIRSPQTLTTGTAYVVDHTAGSAAASQPAFGDLDGDGDVDMAIRWTSLFALHQNEGMIHMPVTRPLYPWNNSTRPGRVQLKDVNGDGHLDIIGHDIIGDNRLEWAMNDGTGNLSETYSVFTSVAGPLRDVADMNGDGHPDILFWYSIYYNNGESTDWEGVEMFPMHGVEAVLVRDLDGDGDNDMLLKTSDDLVVRSENDGAGNFTETILMTIDQQFVTIDLMDVNMDGILDLTAHVNNGGWTWYRGMDDGSFTFASQVGSINSGIVAGDFDLDGDPDVVFEQGDFTFQISSNNGSGQFTGVARSKPRGDLQAVDLDSDGDLDLICNNAHDTYVLENLTNSPFRIEGLLFVDTDADGIRDPGELPLPLHGLVAQPGPVTAMSASDGTYRLLTDVGTHAVTPVQDGLWAISPGSNGISVELTVAEAVAEGIDIGVVPVVDSTLFNVAVSTTAAPCGSNATRTLTVMNIGTTMPSGEFCYTLDEVNQFVSSTPAPDSQSGNTYCWDLADMGYNASFVVQMELTLPSIDFINATIADSAHVQELDANGTVLQDQRWDWNQVVTCSYDPNKKEVHPAGNGPHGVVDVSTRYLDYTIHFQNTGTAPAHNVVLHDVLQPALEGGELQVLAFSHEPTLVQVNADNDLVVRFDGIMLPDSSSDPLGSQGFFSFRVPLLDEAGHITVIDNTAGILFDNNEPVITNTTITTLVDCNQWQPAITEIGGGGVLLASAGLAYQWSFNDEPLSDDTTRVLFATEHGTYRVQVTSVHGCASSAVYYLGSVGLVELAATRFGAFPNPAVSELHVVSNEPLTTEHRIEILDVQGKVMQTLRGNGSTDQMIALPTTAAGLYLLRISHNQEQLGLLKVVMD